MSKILKNFLIGLGILFGFVVLLNIMSFFTIVNPGERGILLQLGNMKGVYEPGLHFQMPIINNVVIIDVQTQKYEDVVDAASKDLQSIEGTIALNYHIDPSKVDVLFQQVG
ncbi:prohibitin family protein, partial [Candidatus Peregrinibacteria bacterium]|nr:prohibitin family protein [Candidatus Peregrinibacteria bacterium]